MDQNDDRAQWSTLTLKKPREEIQVNSKWRRFFILLGFFLLILEFKVGQLFLWPIDYSCAKGPNTNEHFINAKNQSIEANVVQENLFNAASEDALTQARASSMGIDFDDISSCFEYPIIVDNITGTSMVMMEGLINCKHGLHFEHGDHSLSIVEDFQLACSRQWQKILLPEAIAAGILLGMLLANLILYRSLWCTTDSYNKLVSLIKLQLAFCAVSFLTANYRLTSKFEVHLGTYILDKKFANLYKDLLVNFMSNATLISLSMTKIMMSWKSNNRENLNQLKDNQLYLIIVAFMYTTIQATFQPIALRLFKHWTQLNKLLSIIVPFYAASMTIFETINKISSGLFERVETEPNQLNICDTNEQIPDEKPLNSIENGCEFCRPVNHNDPQAIDVTSTCYAPTTEPSAFNTCSGRIRCRRSISNSSASRYFKPMMRVKLHLMLFCVLTNYYLLKMLPDHELMHPETTASRLIRKTAYNNQLLTFANSSQKQKAVDLNYSIEDEHSSLSTNNATSPQFDYQSHGLAQQSSESMNDSNNPFVVLWTTVVVGGWPIELLVVLLHVNSIVNFESSYFKPHRLMSLISFGARTLFVAWVLLAIFKGRYHLLEKQWLYAIIYMIARFCSSLMLYNFLHTILKLGYKIKSGHLLGINSSIICFVVSLSIASTAPILERTDLVIIPLLFILINSMTDLLVQNLRRHFRESLCPLIFEEDPMRLT